MSVFWGDWYIPQLATLHLKMHLKKFANSEGVHSTTFHPTLKIKRFKLIYFMGFPVILGTLQSFQICIFNRKQDKLMFSNSSQLMEKKVYGKFAIIIGQYI